MRKIRGHRSKLDRWILLAGMLAFATFTGCSGLNVDRAFSWTKGNSNKPQPGRLSVVWNQATRKRSNKQTLRGFQGEIQFFAKDAKNGEEAESGKPIRTEGMLTVYAFDESAAGKNGPGRPKKYVFIDKKFKTLYRDSKLGATYVVWLPWDAVGGAPKNVRLMVRFDPADNGPVLMSPDTRLALHSNPDRPQADAKFAKTPAPKRDSAGAITQTGFETSAPPEDGKSDVRDPGDGKEDVPAGDTPPKDKSVADWTTGVAPK